MKKPSELQEGESLTIRTPKAGFYTGFLREYGILMFVVSSPAADEDPSLQQVVQYHPNEEALADSFFGRLTDHDRVGVV